MNCMYEQAQADYWDAFARFLFQPAAAPQPVPERLASLSTLLLDLLVPFGVADPVMALHCPLGVSAGLHQLALLCVDHLGQGCLQRALRLLHLSKLFMLFNFNDYGAWMAGSRWRTDHSQLSSEALRLTHLARDDPRTAVAPIPEPPDHRDPDLRVGLVTYCNYNDNATRLTAQSRSNKQAYAARHSYELLHFEKPFVAQAHPWMNKLIAVQGNVDRFDWLVWVDCDLFFMNPHRTLDSIIKSALAKNPDASFIIAEDGAMLNSGVFMMRNSAWSADFLAQSVDLLSAPMPYSFQHMPWHEQAPVMFLLLVPGVLDGLASAGSPLHSLPSGYDDHVVIVPQRAMNSYPQELTQKTTHAIPHEGYVEGDLAISFNGCSSILGAEFCEVMYEHYHGVSMERFVHSL